MARQALVGNGGRVTIVLAGGSPVAESDPWRNLKACESLGIECLSWPAQSQAVASRIAEAHWVFDGISGTGLRGALRAPLADMVGEVNDRARRVVAIDVPSGVWDGFRAGQPAVRAEVTISMGLPKLCLYLPHARGFCGEIIVAPVGFPPQLVEDPSIPGEFLDETAWRRIAPRVPLEVHKNARGHLAVLAGAQGTTGAAWLSATAAARCRVGLVSLFASRDVYPILAQKSASVMVKPWDEEMLPAAGLEAAEGGPRAAGESNRFFDPRAYSGFLVGPGWGLTQGRERWLQELLSFDASGVIDADGITLLSRIAARRKVALGGRWVLTPHPGEFSRLTGVPKDQTLDDPVKHAVEASARLDAVIALKGHCTFVAEPSGRYWILDGENPALATGGSGDVLAGIIAAAIAGGMSPLDAALFGVSLHSHIGRILRRRGGWFLAEDLVPPISRVLR
jgi:NAD(P)H-hydrate epimerase